MIAVTKYRSSQGQLVWMACMKGSSKNRVTSSSLYPDSQNPAEIRGRAGQTQAERTTGGHKQRTCNIQHGASVCHEARCKWDTLQKRRMITHRCAYNSGDWMMAKKDSKHRGGSKPTSNLRDSYSLDSEHSAPQESDTSHTPRFSIISAMPFNHNTKLTSRWRD